MEIIINAVDARKESKEAKKELEDNLKYGYIKELEKIDELIRDAIKEGLLEIHIKEMLKDETIKILELLSYEIEISERYYTHNTIIKW